MSRSGFGGGAGGGGGGGSVQEVFYGPDDPGPIGTAYIWVEALDGGDWIVWADPGSGGGDVEPQYPAGLAQYVFNQTPASDTWVITHNFGFKPGGITLLDLAGNLLLGNISHNDENIVTITFATPHEGFAYLS